ncbi:MAG: hypothetical protein HQM15_00305 [Deltaproteobacteria bacterium]|nr:hypothetical protein [Deltaproteobacteria bacterium]
MTQALLRSNLKEIKPSTFSAKVETEIDDSQAQEIKERQQGSPFFSQDMQKGFSALEKRKSAWDANTSELRKRATHFLKGFFIDGPGEMIKGVVSLSPLENIYDSFKKEWEHFGYHAEQNKTWEGAKENFKENLRMMPGMKPLEGLGNMALHPLQTWEGVKQQYQEKWNSDEGKGSIAFEVATLIAPVAKVGKIGELGEIGAIGDISKFKALSKLPHGFKDVAEFEVVGNKIHQALAEAGFPEAKAHLFGSAVTGKNFRLGHAFDAVKRSDFDFSISGKEIFERAKEVRAPLASRRRTWPLEPNYSEKLGLHQLTLELKNYFQREVTFVIYDSEATLSQRGYYINFLKK